MKDKIIYYIGKNWPWFRKWYYERSGNRYLWGINGFLNDFKPSKGFDWAKIEE